MSYATIIIDMQEDFFSHERLKKNKKILTEKINQLASITRTSGAHLIWIKQEFAQDLSNAPLEVRKKKINITVSGTPGAEILAQLTIEDTDSIIVKTRYSAFFNTTLKQKLKELECSTIITAGINSHACVRTTVIDAYQHDFEVILASDCIDSYDFKHHDVSMEYMSDRLGIPKTNNQIQNILTS